jgi:Fe-S cluster biosynthesis and repair protein YggX
MITCSRCGREGDPPSAAKVAFLGSPHKERVAGSFCSACWQEWEGVEVKVINEYRLNFMDPEHRALLKRACVDFFQLSQ